MSPYTGLQRDDDDATGQGDGGERGGGREESQGPGIGVEIEIEIRESLAAGFFSFSSLVFVCQELAGTASGWGWGGCSRHGFEHVFVEAVELLHLHALDAHLLDQLREHPGVRLDGGPLHRARGLLFARQVL